MYLFLPFMLFYINKTTTHTQWTNPIPGAII